MKKIIKIEKMNCEHCAKKVEKSLLNIAGITNVKVDLIKKEAILESNNNIDNKLLKEVIEKLDYEVKEINEATE